MRRMAYRTGITVVDGECEPGECGDDDATLPRCTISVRADDARDQSITNLILYLHIVHYSSVLLVSTSGQAKKTETLRSDEELILDVDEMLGHLYGYMRDLSVLNMDLAEKFKPLR